MNTQLRIFAVGRIIPFMAPIIVTEQDAWHAAMQDSIDASLEVDDAGAYELGHAHAISGHPFRAGVFERMCDRAEYAVGFRDAQSTLDYEGYLQDVGWLGEA